MAALVVVVKAPMLLLHHISLTLFSNDAKSTALFQFTCFHLLQKQEHRNPVRQQLLCFRWWSQSPKCACRACGTTSTRLSKDPGRPTQAPAGSARPLHASHTRSGDPRPTRGTGRAAREVPSIQQVPLLSMSRDLTTHKRARPTVDWARETFARHTRALQTRDQHAAPVAPFERRQGPWSAVR